MRIINLPLELLHELGRKIAPLKLLVRHYLLMQRNGRLDAADEILVERAMGAGEGGLTVFAEADELAISMFLEPENGGKTHELSHGRKDRASSVRMCVVGEQSHERFVVL